VSDVPEVPGGQPKPAEHASSPPPAKDASATPATGDGGGNGKDSDGKGDGGDAPKPQGGHAHLIARLGYLVVALAFVGILASVFLPYFLVLPKDLDKTLLQALAHTETARGLITFLVAVSTVGIALILIVSLALEPLARGRDVVKERFGFSKEVLTSLIGILGTIIGFYFGPSQDQTRGHGTNDADARKSRHHPT
jgi:hypothetical protein